MQAEKNNGEGIKTPVKFCACTTPAKGIKTPVTELKFCTCTIPEDSWKSSIFSRLTVKADKKNKCEVKDDEWNYSVVPNYLMVALFGIIPCMSFYAWFVPIAPRLQGEIVLALILASLWILLSPLLMVIGELKFAKLLYFFAHDDRGDEEDEDKWSWYIKKYIGKLPKGTYIYWSVAGSLGLLFGTIFFFRNDAITDVLGIGDITIWFIILGTACLAFTGFSSGNGVWGLYKIIRLYTFIVKKSKIKWYPYAPKQINGFELLARHGFLFSMLYSCGVLFVPITYYIYIESDSFIKYIFALGILFLALGSMILYLSSFSILFHISRKAKEEALQTLSQRINIILREKKLDFLAERENTNGGNKEKKTDRGTNISGDEESDSLPDMISIYYSTYRLKSNTIIEGTILQLSALAVIPTSVGLFVQFSGGWL